MDVKKAEVDYKAIKDKVQNDIKKTRTTLLELYEPDIFLAKCWSPVELTSPVILYKVVAAKQGKLLSIFDGSTEYDLGKWKRSATGAASWPPVMDCFFCYSTPQEAAQARFPSSRKLSESPKVLIQLLALGKAYQHSNGMWAVSQLKPMALLSTAPQRGAPPSPTAQRNASTFQA